MLAFRCVLHAWMCTRVRVYVHVCMSVCVPACVIYTHMCACVMHRYTHNTHIHVCMYIRLDMYVYTTIMCIVHYCDLQV